MLTIKYLSDKVHKIAKSKGFWDKPRNDSELIMLMVTELAEGVEALRLGNPKSEHIPEFTAIEEELSDCIIRILDMCKERGYRIEEALLAKIKFNEGREYLHGKKF